MARSLLVGVAALLVTGLGFAAPPAAPKPAAAPPMAVYKSPT